MFLRLDACLIKQSCTLDKDHLSIRYGLVKIVLFVRVSSNKYGVGDILERESWSSPLVGYNKKQIQRVVDLRWMRPDHAIRSSVAITKLPLGRDILKKKNKKGEMQFFENIFSLDFF